jgi:hypothetical protein
MITAEQQVDHAIVSRLIPAAVDVLDRLRVGCTDAELIDRSDRLVSFWSEVKQFMTRPSTADARLVNDILPKLYVAIDDLLDNVTPTKSLLIEAKKQLPDWAPHSFAQSKGKP